MGENPAATRPDRVKKTLTKLLNNISSDQDASNVAQKFYADMPARANIARVRKIPLEVQDGEIRSLGLIDHRPDIVIETKMDKKVAQMNQKAADTGEAPRPTERTVIELKKGASLA